MDLKYERLELGKLLLDPNNYRFFDDNPIPPVPERRFGEDTVQASAIKKLRDDASLLSLKDSILANGFLPSEPLVVRRYDNDRFLVIDGNRRATAVHTLIDEYKGGADYDPSLIDSLKSLPSVIVTVETGGEISYGVLMGVRHLSGVKRWGGYAEARLINDLAEKGGQQVEVIADRIGLDVGEINRRRRAFKATEQFKNHSEYKKAFKTEMYALFHEAVAIPALRDRYKWDSTKMEFGDADLADQFFSMLVPQQYDDRLVDAKLKTFGDVRKFGKHIVSDDEMVAQLLQPDSTLDGMIANLDRDREEREWSVKVKKLLRQLNQIPALAVSKASEEEKQLLHDVLEAINTLVKQANGNLAE